MRLASASIRGNRYFLTVSDTKLVVREPHFDVTITIILSSVPLTSIFSEAVNPNKLVNSVLEIHNSLSKSICVSFVHEYVSGAPVVFLMKYGTYLVKSTNIFLLIIILSLSFSTLLIKIL